MTTGGKPPTDTEVTPTSNAHVTRVGLEQRKCGRHRKSQPPQLRCKPKRAKKRPCLRFILHKFWFTYIHLSAVPNTLITDWLGRGGELELQSPRVPVPRKKKSSESLQDVRTDEDVSIFRNLHSCEIWLFVTVLPGKRRRRRPRFVKGSLSLQGYPAPQSGKMENALSFVVEDRPLASIPTHKQVWLEKYEIFRNELLLLSRLLAVYLWGRIWRRRSGRSSLSGCAIPERFPEFCTTRALVR